MLLNLFRDKSKIIKKKKNLEKLNPKYEIWDNFRL